MTEISKKASSVDSIVITNKQGRMLEDVEVVEVGGGSELFQFTRRGTIGKVLDGFKPDLVHLHGGIFAALLAMSPAFKDRHLILSLYAWPSLPAPSDLWKNALRGLSSRAVLSLRVAASGLMPEVIVRRALMRPSLVGIITQDSRLQERLGPLARPQVYVIPGGADFDGIRATPVSSPVVVSAGRAELSRGFDLLLFAIAELLGRGMDVQLKLMVLPGREVHKIRNLMQDLGIDKQVEIIEGISPDLRRELATGSVAAFPFRYDYTTSAAPLTVMESMSVGLPVVGTDVACMAPILQHGINGLVVPKGDRVALADAIGRLIVDGSLWGRLSDGALDTIRRWNWQSSVDQVVSVYKEALRREANV